MPTTRRETVSLAYGGGWFEIYRRLGVAELWRWTKGRIEVRRLVTGQYELTDRSASFPSLDLSLLERLCVYTSQPTAVRELRQALRAATE